jgi:hypothetical protein
LSTSAEIQLQANAATTSNYKLLRICCWIVTLALGAAQAWATRFTMNPDGISYLDVGDAYWRGDWHNALNAYWSPLYSWILGFFLKVLKPSAYWEYPVAHLVNFLIYAASLGCFEFFLMTFISERRRRDQELQKVGRTGLPDSAWWLLGHSLFLSSSILLAGLYLVTPDTGVTALVYLASAFMLKIARGADKRIIYVGLGLALGFAYLAKSVMFPLAFVYLFVAVLARGISKRSVANVAIAFLAFLAVAGPLVGAISHQKGRLTFGDTGSWTYSFYVNHVDYWIPNSSQLTHPMTTLSSSPPVYEFDRAGQGTFPPWYDPTYWHDGIRPRPTIKGEIEPIKIATILYTAVFFVLFANVTMGGIILHFTSDDIGQSLRRSGQSWPIVVPALSALILYSLVHVETRFVGAQTAILFLGAYCGISFPAHRARQRLAVFTVASVVATSVMMVAFAVWSYGRSQLSPVYPKAAAALHEHGVQASDRIGLIWNEKWNAGAAEGPFVPRLLRLRIVAEETDADAFWKLDATARNSAMQVLRKTGVKAILALRVPVPLQEGWINLDRTDYFAYVFPGKFQLKPILQPGCELRVYSPMYVSLLMPSMLRNTDEKRTSIPRKRDSEQKNTALTE